MGTHTHCSHHGLVCFDDHIAQNKAFAFDSCIKNCHGIYADIQREAIANNNTVTIKDEKEKGFEKVFQEYEEYKKGYVMNYNNFFTDIAKLEGVPFLNDLVQENLTACINSGGDNCLAMVKKRGRTICNDHNKCTFKIIQLLKVVEIYLDSPTFDKVTMDAKTNFVTQVSVVGGTLGLFSGFSLLSGFEIFYFIIKFIADICKGRRKQDKSININ